MSTFTSPRFHFGPVVATPGALEALERNRANAMYYLHRHGQGDWGEVPEEDRQANEAALKYGKRLLSVYVLRDQTRLWIITDGEIDAKHHRYATTLLLPEEY